MAATLKTVQRAFSLEVISRVFVAVAVLQWVPEGGERIGDYFFDIQLFVNEER